jgi:methionyl-tRNA formyltransferase
VPSARKRVPLADDATLRVNNRRIADAGSDLLVNVLKRTADESIAADPMDTSAGSYYSFPDRADVQAFQERGHRFFALL